jgi:hypothetical protein
MGVVPGAPLQITFEPGYVQSDDMFYDDLNFGVLPAPAILTTAAQQQDADKVEEPPPSFHFPDKFDPLSKKRAVAAAAADIQLLVDPSLLSSSSGTTTKPTAAKKIKTLLTKPSSVTFADQS